MVKMVKHGQTFLKWSNCSKMVKNGSKWSKMVQNGSKWYKMVQNGENCPKWFKIV